MKGATFRRVPPPPAHIEPPITRVKKQERGFWRKDAKRAVANGYAYDSPDDFTNLDLLRLLAMLDLREEEVRRFLIGRSK